MAMLPDGRTETIHVQVGLNVYIFETDEILPNDENLLTKVKGLKEVQGTAQGRGIETVWWDTSEQPVVESYDAYQLRELANMVRKLGQDTKEIKPKVKLIYKP